VAYAQISFEIMWASLILCLSYFKYGWWNFFSSLDNQKSGDVKYENVVMERDPFLTDQLWVFK